MQTLATATLSLYLDELRVLVSLHSKTCGSTAFYRWWLGATHDTEHVCCPTLVRSKADK